VRLHHCREPGEDTTGAPFYSDRERERAKTGLGEIRISGTVNAFARRLGARCIGRPVRHPSFPRFVLPMLVALDELPRSTLMKFDLSLLGPPIAPEPSAAALLAGEHAANTGRMAS